MNKPALKTLLVFMAFCLYLSNCTVDPIQFAGGSSDTEVSVNAIAGSVVDQNGKPVANAVVTVQPSYFSDSNEAFQRPNPNSPRVAGRQTSTDANGAFKIDSLDTGLFSIEVNSGDSIAVLRSFSMTPTDTCIHFIVDTLKPTVTITGTIVPGAPHDIFIQYNGIERHITIDSSGRFLIRIPAGAKLMRVYAKGQPIDRPMQMPDLKPGAVQDIGVVDPSSGPSIPPACNDSLCDVTSLQLFLTDCGINSAAADSIATFRGGRIVALNLQHRGLRELSPEIIRLSKLEILDLHGNMLMNPWIIIAHCAELKTLRLDSNNMRFITDHIVMMRNLNELDVSANELSSLPISITELKPAFLNLANNRLLNISGTVADWATTYDPDWLSTQKPAESGANAPNNDKNFGGPP